MWCVRSHMYKIAFHEHLGSGGLGSGPPSRGDLRFPQEGSTDGSPDGQAEVGDDFGHPHARRSDLGRQVSWVLLEGTVPEHRYLTVDYGDRTLETAGLFLVF